jgi:D-aminoacyl-tRNA deacylase
MRAVVQRVCRASVTVDGKEISRIGEGLLVYLGVGADDDPTDLEYLVRKVTNLRVFRDESGAMNRSVRDAGGAVLAVSQFTLYGDVRRGNRPSFIAAMEPGAAKRMYERFIAAVEERGLTCRGGRFGAMMDIDSINDGPVTILIDSKTQGSKPSV